MAEGNMLKILLIIKMKKKLSTNERPLKQRGYLFYEIQFSNEIKYSNEMKFILIINEKRTEKS
jgi:hypothetical protein